MPALARLLRAGGPRVITLTGLPGVGRTRLARHALEEHADATGWLVLDDLDAGPAVDDLARALADDPAVRALVTASGPLHLADEHIVRVEPLPVPAVDAGPDELAANPAVQLFVDAAGVTGVTIEPASFDDVGAICARLGGLPLAIEVAASRSCAYSPTTLRRLLDRRPCAEVLGAEPGGAELFATLDRRTAVLPPRERRLLAHLATFHGPVPVAAVEAVAGRHALEDLGALIEVQLVAVDHRDGRSLFHLHPLIREQVTQSTASDPDDDPREHHRRWAVGVAEDEILRRDARAGDVHAREVEADLESALRRSLQLGDRRGAALLALALAPIWIRGVMSAPRRGLLVDAASAAARAGVGTGVEARLRAHLALEQADAVVTEDDRRVAAHAVDAAVELARGGEPADVVAVLRLAVQAARMLGSWEESAARCAEGIELARASGDERSAIRFEIWAGMIAHQQGRADDAARWATDALHHARQQGDLRSVVAAGGLLRSLPAAVRPADAPAGTELVSAARESGDQWSLVWLLAVAATDRLAAGDQAAAARTASELVETARDAGSWAWTELATAVVVSIAQRRRDDEVAAGFHGVVAGRLPVLASTMPPAYLAAYERGIARVRERMGAGAFDRAVQSGAALPNAAVVERLVSYLRTVIDEPRSAADDHPLTAREREVLARLVAGDTNSQLADRLGISTKTAMHHTSSIYRKLQVGGRAEAAAWAVAHPSDG